MDLAASSRMRHVLAATAGAAAAAPRLCVVTGANKGIGYAIAKELAATPGVRCVATARSAERGRAAVAQLIAEGAPADSIEFGQLDLDSADSIDAFAGWLGRAHGGLDILVNNAAIAFNSTSPELFEEQARPTLHTNFFQTSRLTERLKPLLRADARVVFVASGSGTGRIGGASGGGGIVGGIGGTDGLAEGGGEGGRGGCDGGRGDGTNGGDIGGSGGGNAGGVSGGSTGIATVTLEAAPKATGSLDKTKRAIAIMLRAPSDRAHIAPLRRQWENSSPGSPSSFSSSSSSSPSTSSSSSASTTSALLIPAGTTCLFWFRVVLFLLTKKEACGSSLSNASASLPFP